MMQTIVAALLLAGLGTMALRDTNRFIVRRRDEFYCAAAAVTLVTVPVGLGVLLLGASGSGVLGIAASACLAAALLGAARYAICPPAPHAPGERTIDLPRRSAVFETGKRLLDIACAGCGIVILAPVFLAVAVAIRIDSGDPVVFRQTRIGRDGVPFEIFKFRTMRPDAGNAWVVQGDARITPFGQFLRRTSLDELPQLFNVLRGEMSIVGPRPEMQSYAEEFARTIPAYALRHAVKPGITGWAQVHAKRNLDPSDAPDILKFDLFYVANRTLLLDLSLIYKTAAEFLFHRAV